MSCRRVARELIEFFRFGDLDARSAPHLDHLEVCQACREEVGLDRELVLQLQRALQARVDGHAASPGAWLEIRRRAVQPEAPSWRTRLWPVLRLTPMGAMLIVLVAVIAPVAGFSPFRAPPQLSSIQTWQNFTETAANDPVDPYDGRWWLRYISAPPPSEPLTGLLPAVDPGERVVALAEPAGGPTQ